MRSSLATRRLAGRPAASLPPSQRSQTHAYARAHSHLQRRGDGVKAERLVARGEAAQREQADRLDAARLHHEGEGWRAGESGQQQAAAEVSEHLRKQVRTFEMPNASRSLSPAPAACHLWKAARPSPCANTSSSACRRALSGRDASAFTCRAAAAGDAEGVGEVRNARVVRQMRALARAHERQRRRRWPSARPQREDYMRPHPPARLPAAPGPPCGRPGRAEEGRVWRRRSSI